MRTSIRATLVVLILAALVGLGGLAASADQPSDNITICHRTNSNANPYVIITTDPNGQNGNTDHFNEHTGPVWNDTLKKQKIEWGDVIPPSAAHPAGSEAYQDLIELGLDPDAFIANGCESPPVPTHGVTLDKVTTGGTAPSADTEFTFTVTCESGTVTSPVSIAPEDDPVSVASGVAEDDLCTITETVGNGADSVSYQVSGGSEDSTGINSVTVGVGADTAVVATNAYPEPEPEVVTPEPPQVLGEVITPTPAPAQLPHTGSNTTYVAMVGAALLLVGSLARLASRRLVVAAKG